MNTKNTTMQKQYYLLQIVKHVYSVDINVSKTSKTDPMPNVEPCIHVQNELHFVDD